MEGGKNVGTPAEMGVTIRLQAWNQTESNSNLNVRTGWKPLADPGLAYGCHVPSLPNSRSIPKHLRKSTSGGFFGLSRVPNRCCPATVVRIGRESRDLSSAIDCARRGDL
jgi:hypothetical protein